MHKYSVNSNQRKTIIAVLAIVSVSVNMYLGTLFQKLIGFDISIPSAMALFGILYLLFDKFIWKLPLLHKLGVIKSPNLNGIWEGELFSSYDEHGTAYQIKITISQTWTDISFCLSASTSCSESFMAGLLVDNPSEVKIIYVYRNAPKADAVETMQMHTGTTLLTYDNIDKLEGEYYSGRGRSNTGLIKVRKTSTSK